MARPPTAVPTDMHGHAVSATTSIYALRRNDPDAVVALWKAFHERNGRWPNPPATRTAVLLQDDPDDLIARLAKLIG